MSYEPQLDAQDQPVFIVGCHRSGTTLLRYILDCHPNLASPPESKFIAGLEAFLHYSQVQEALASLGFERPDVMVRLRTLTDSFLGDYAKRHRKRRWIDKTPNYFRILPFIHELFGGEVLFLMMVRHPLDCAISLDEFIRFPSVNHADPELAEAVRRFGEGRCGWAHYWADTQQRVLEFLNSHPTQCHLVKYERLVTEPAAAIADICGFIGEEYKPNLIVDAFKRHHDDGFQDQKIKRTRGIVKSQVGRWRALPAEEVKTLWAIVGIAAAAFGYAEPDLCTAGRTAAG